jgi:hypothetical protein
MIQIAAFWKKESKEGKPYYQGRLGNNRLLLFKNEHKKEDKHPDLVLFLAESERRNEKGTEEEGEEDIPF